MKVQWHAQTPGGARALAPCPLYQAGALLHNFSFFFFYLNIKHSQQLQQLIILVIEYSIILVILGDSTQCNVFFTLF